jgi:type I restriction enzyme S subunit
MYGSVRFPTFRVNEARCFPPYLFNYFRTETGRDQLARISPGSAGRNRVLSLKRLPEVLVPLPSLNEQRGIVARIKELAALIEEAQGLRANAREETEALFDSTARIMFDEKWDYASIEKLVGRENLRNGKSVKETDLPTDIHCLRLSAMRHGRIDCIDAKPVLLSREEAKPYLVSAGDVFITRGNGSKRLVGRAGLVEKCTKGTIFPDLLIQVPLDHNKILPAFFVAWWNSPRMREVIEDAAKTTSGIWKVNQGHIASFSIPILPLADQRRIVAYLNNLKAQVGELTALQDATQAELDVLLPSVLDRAFKGEL